MVACTPTQLLPSQGTTLLLGIRKGRESSNCIFKKEFYERRFSKNLEKFAKILKTKKKNWKKKIPICDQFPFLKIFILICIILNDL